MNTTSLHIKIDPEVKEEAQKTAEELGLSLSAVTKALLAQFVRTKQLTVGFQEVPNSYLIQSLKQSEKDINAGRTKSFKNGQAALDYIDSLIENEKHNK